MPSAKHAFWAHIVLHLTHPALVSLEMRGYRIQLGGWLRAVGVAVRVLYYEEPLEGTLSLRLPHWLLAGDGASPASVFTTQITTIYRRYRLQNRRYSSFLDRKYTFSQ